MNILGISGLNKSVTFKKRELPDLSEREYRVTQGFDSAAVLLTSQGVQFAAAEERFTREKTTGNFPVLALEQLFKSTGVKPEDIDAVAHGFNYRPFKKYFAEEDFHRKQYAEVFDRSIDHVGALQALSAMLAALYRQQKTGLGCCLDMSLVEPVLAWQYLAESDADNRLLCGDAAYYNIYPTADNRFITLAALEAKFWSAFCTAVNKPEWIERQVDAKPQSSLKAELGSLFSSQPLLHWQLILDGVDCCFEPIPLKAEAGQSEQARVRGLKNHFPGKIDGRNTPVLGGFESFEPGEINWINE